MNNAHTFNTPEVAALARQYREALRQFVAFVDRITDDMDVEAFDAISDALLDAESALTDAAMERLQAVGTPEQLAQISRIAGTHDFLETVATNALA